MKTYEFSIVASGVEPSAANFEDAFFEAGCDDATIAFQRGMLILEFGREAKSLEQAIASAVRDVKKAGAKVERIEPDPLVSLAEIAKRTGLSRAAITQFALGQRGEGFPLPAARITTESPLWEWLDIACWMHAHSKAGVDAEAIREARVMKDANDALASRRAAAVRHAAKRKKKHREAA